MIDITEDNRSFNYEAVPEFMVTCHTADVDIQTFMSENSAIEKAKSLAEILPGHTFLVFGLIAEARSKVVDVEIRRILT